MEILTIEGHTVDVRPIGKDSVILDLGANRGRFSQRIHELTGCRCVAVEANPELCAEVRRQTSATVYCYAIAGREGSVRLRINENSEGSTILDVARAGETHVIEVESITLEKLSKSVGIDRFDLVKVDIEGAEVAMFDGCSDAWLRSIPQIAVEFHDFNGLASRSEVIRIKRRLEELGFIAISMWMRSYGDTLFINRRHHQATFLQLMWFKHVMRNRTRIANILGRWLGGLRTSSGKPC
jgi:FkbM family methyltransferase